MERVDVCNATNFYDLNMDYCLRSKDMNSMVMCFKKTVTHVKGLWRAENALAASLPLLVLQLFVILCVNRVLVLALRPLRVPRIAAEILGGILMGPSALGTCSLGRTVIYPYNSVITLESIANLGIIYYMFLVGLEVDMKPVVRAGKKALSTAIAGLILPVPVGYGLHHLLLKNPAHANQYGPIFWGVVLGTTNFPDLARILADNKLLHSEVGRTALSSAVVTDIFSWILFVLAVAVINDGKVFTVIATCLFLLFYIFALSPAVLWMLRKTSKNQNYTNNHICFVLAGVIASAYITDAIGCQSILGAYMFGVILPKGELKHALLDTLEDYVSGLMTPFFFLVIGLRTDMIEVFRADASDGASAITVARFLAVTLLALSTKIVSTFLAAIFFNRMKPRDGLALGLLMNTKGLLALIITNSARDLMVLSTRTYSAMVFAIWLMTAAVGPTIALVYRSTNITARHRLGRYKNKTVRSLEPNSEFRILSCINSAANVSGLLNLLTISNPTKQSPIFAFAVHLVELVGHASAMLIVHDTCNIDSSSSSSDRDLNRSTDHIISTAFENLERHTPNMTVQSLTAMSSYTTMHEDICNLAEDKRAALILLPFHKQLSEEVVVVADQNENSPFRSVNKNVIDNASCSVAIFVDRGGLTNMQQSPNNININNDDHHHAQQQQQQQHNIIAMLFIGGRDDREALAYACRMHECGNPNPSVSLTVMRFVPNQEAMENDYDDDDDNSEKERQLDEQCIEGVKQKAAKNNNKNSSVKIVEVEVGNGDEIMKVLSSMEEQFDLYVVGKGRGAQSCLTSGFSDWSEWPELGPLGDILVCSSFAPTTSILVVQQGFVSAEDENELGGVGAGQLKDNFNGHHHMTWHPPSIDKPHFAPFVNRKHTLNDDDDDHHII